MKAVRDAVICFTPPYGKFATGVQMLSCGAAMQPTLHTEVGPVRRAQVPTLTLGRLRVRERSGEGGEAQKLLGFGGLGVLDALGAELLALLSMQPLLIGLLGALDGFRAVGLLGLGGRSR
jgi:hypothetical protein